jgi:phosphatidate phosphatase APP1
LIELKRRDLPKHSHFVEVLVEIDLRIVEVGLMTNPSKWRKRLRGLATDVEERFDRLWGRFHNHLNRDPLLIIPYLGYATPKRIFLRGRVLEDEGIKSAAESDTIWQNLVNMYRRFESDEVPHATVRARFLERELTLTADHEGFFELHIPLDEPLPSHQQRWDVHLELIEAPDRGELPSVEATGQIVVPSRNAQFAVVSDLDDTVLKTDAYNILKMARNTFFHNAYTRLPFKGVAAFYRALKIGSTPDTDNPIFYVSSSPWNLYDLIADFFAVRDIPMGPIFLRDAGLSRREGFGTHALHKRRYIEMLMEDYPDIPFILIGDSGQHDPEIYRHIVDKYPDRIAAIYIRDVNNSARRDAQVQALISEVLEHDVEMLLVPDTLAAAEHAALRGFITAQSLKAIVQEFETVEAVEPDDSAAGSEILRSL